MSETGDRPEKDPAEQAARTVDDLTDRSDDVGADIDKARASWEAKQSDPSVPGAVEPDADSDSAAEDDA